MTAAIAGQSARVLVCFDFEGAYGMPHRGEPYDLDRAASAILDELAAARASAVFFIVGRLIEEHPEVVAKIAAAGHEIGLHGYEHDNLARYDAAALTLLGENLAKVGALLEELTGTPPRAFRAPYLLWPLYYRSEIYAMLREHGYRWVSNRYIRYPVELLRPRQGHSRLPGYIWRASDGTPRLARNSLLTGLLNRRLVWDETFGGSRLERLRWLLGSRAPFLRDGLTEVPVHVPLDCDLIGLPRPSEDSPRESLDYARAVIGNTLAEPGGLVTVTFHDWLVSSGNRPVLLRDTLTAARSHGATISTIAKHPEWLHAWP